MLGSKYVNTYIGNVCKPTHFMMWNSALFVEMYNYLVTSCKPNLSGGLIVDTFWNKIVLFRLILWHWLRFFNQSQQQCLIKFRANSEFVYCLFNEKTAHLKLKKKQSLIWWRNGWLYNMYVEGSWHNEAKQVIFTVSCLTSVGCLLTCQKARNCGSSITMEGEWAF